MDAFLPQIAGWLVEHGPWIVALVAAVETAVFLGLLVPAEATVLTAAFLAERGLFPVEQVLAATVAGGLAGDQIGYLLGRYGGTRVVASDGRIGRLWRRHERATASLFRRHSVLAVSFARLISFVRTLMPWFAGMSRVPYGRFLAYDTLGVLVWAGASVALGYLAGGSWRLVADTLGTAFAIAAALGVGLVLLVRWRARRGRRGSGDATAPAVYAGGVEAGALADDDR